MSVVWQAKAKAKLLPHQTSHSTSINFAHHVVHTPSHILYHLLSFHALSRTRPIYRRPTRSTFAKWAAAANSM